MKGFERNNQLLALCGLNCGLCPMLLGKYCPDAAEVAEIKGAGSQGAGWNTATRTIVSAAPNTRAINTIILTNTILSSPIATKKQIWKKRGKSG